MPRTVARCSWCSKAWTASGKDSAIKWVTSGVNPQGFRVSSFTRPTSQEIEHTWLHRHWLTLPERGRIGIFNRSHYEEVVTLRVHPEFLAARKLPPRPVDETFWDERLADIVAFERHLASNGTTVLKFYLNVSRAEQKRRLSDRLRNPEKHWKFDPSDLEARKRWDAYQRAYEAAFQATSTPTAPVVRRARGQQACRARDLGDDHPEDVGRDGSAVPRGGRSAGPRH